MVSKSFRGEGWLLTALSCCFFFLCEESSSGEGTTQRVGGERGLGFWRSSRKSSSRGAQAPQLNHQAKSKSSGDDQKQAITCCLHALLTEIEPGDWIARRRQLLSLPSLGLMPACTRPAASRCAGEHAGWECYVRHATPRAFNTRPDCGQRTAIRHGGVQEAECSEDAMQRLQSNGRSSTRNG